MKGRRSSLIVDETCTSRATPYKDSPLTPRWTVHTDVQPWGHEGNSTASKNRRFESIQLSPVKRLVPKSYAMKARNHGWLSKIERLITGDEAGNPFAGTLRGAQLSLIKR